MIPCSVCIRDAALMSRYKYMRELENMTDFDQRYCDALEVLTANEFPDIRSSLAQ